MAVIKVNRADFENEVLKADKPVLVDFNADWCGPCKMLGPVLEEISEQRNDVKIVSVNVDDNRELAEKYDIYSIPCIVVIKNGEEVNRHVGLIPKSAVEALIK